MISPDSVTNVTPFLPYVTLLTQELYRRSRPLVRPSSSSEAGTGAVSTPTAALEPAFLLNTTSLREVDERGSEEGVEVIADDATAMETGRRSMGAPADSSMHRRRQPSTSKTDCEQAGGGIHDRQPISKAMDCILLHKSH